MSLLRMSYDMVSSKSISNVKNVYVQGFARERELTGDRRLQVVERLVSKLNFSGKSTSFLDIGCGDGFLVKKFGEQLGVKKLYGVDISEQAVKLAKSERVQARQLDVDLKDLPYKSNFFDFIYCGSLIELIADPDHLLGEIKRVLKDSGTCVITVPNLCSWGSRIAVLLGYLPYYFRVSTSYDLGKLGTGVKEGKSTGFIRLQSLRSFTQLADLYGFKIERVLGAPATGLPRSLSLVDGVLSGIPSLAFQMIFVLRKK